jgi:hypothetical protein
MNKTTLLLAALAFLALNSGSLAKDESADSEGEVSVERMILVRDTGIDFEPVKKFKPSDTFGVLVELSEAKLGTKVKGVWTAVDAGGMLEKKIFEKTVELTEEAIKTVKNPKRIDFTLSHDNPYPTGNYKFEVYLNGEVADTLEFEIE